MKQHTAKRYSVVKHKGRWVVLQSDDKSSLWNLNAGGYLMGANGRSYQVSAQKMEITRGLHGLPLVVMDGAPCSKKRKVCDLYSNHVGVTPPAKGWEKMKAQIYGMSDKDKLFVRGYLASYEGGKVWSYWGQRNTAVNATIVRNGIVHVRKKISNKENKIPLINIPNKNYSKKTQPKWVR